MADLGCGFARALFWNESKQLTALHVLDEEQNSAVWRHLDIPDPSEIAEQRLDPGDLASLYFHAIELAGL
jgi:hypothetical protein